MTSNTCTLDVDIVSINDDPPANPDNPSHIPTEPSSATTPTTGSSSRRRSLRKRAKAPLHSQEDAFTAATGLRGGKKGSRARPAPLNLHAQSLSLAQGRKQSLPSPIKSAPVTFPPRKYSQPITSLPLAFPPPPPSLPGQYPAFAPSPTDTFFGPNRPIVLQPFFPSFSVDSFGPPAAKLIDASAALFQRQQYLSPPPGPPYTDYGIHDGSLNHLPQTSTSQLGPIDMLPLSDLPDRQPLVNPLPPCKPHPYLHEPVIYLSHIPADMREDQFSTFIAQSPADKIIFQHHVPINERLRPDQYYDWMPRHGILHFGTLLAAEKALCIILARSSLKTAGLLASPFPPSPAFHPSSTVMPFPDRPVPARYIASHRHVERVIPRSNDLLDVVAAQLPTPGELFDACRPWGAVRELEVWIQDSSLKDGEPIKWRARVEFWHEDEAHRFELGIGEQGCLIKGWEVHIFPDRPSLYPYIPGLMPSAFPTLTMPAGLGEHDLALASTTPDVATALQQSPMSPYPTLYTPPDALGVPALGYSPPAPPFPLRQAPPWASHNPYAAAPMTPLTPSTPHGPNVSFMRQEPHIQRNGSISSHLSTAFGDMGGESLDMNIGAGRNSITSIDSSMSSFGSAHSKRQRLQRTWSLTLENRPDGIMVPVGTSGSDGSFIAHGPGQHIRPAPPFGPGSTSTSGLVDYSNVYIKNLDPDINSWFLEELFSIVGRVVSARVMRDDRGRSRGYGFISFSSPDEALSAITRFNGQKLGGQYVVMTLHEPRKPPRERNAGNTRTNRSKSITSSLDSATTGHTAPGSPKIVDKKDTGTYDTLRSLDPEVRKATLSQRITTRVEAYAHRYNIHLAYTAPTIAALAGHDLALIPLLYNDDELEAKIAETFEVLLQDQDLAESLCIDSASRDLARSPTPRHDVVLAKPSLSETDMTDSDMMDKLYKGIQAIDPIDTDKILPILAGQLEEGEVERALKSRSFFAFRYGLAKKELLRRQAPVEGENGQGIVTVGPDLAAMEFGLSQIGNVPEVTMSTTTGGDADTPKPSQPPTTAAATMPTLPDLFTEQTSLPDDMDGFAALPASAIVKCLAAPDSITIIQKYGLTRPSRDTALQIAKWMLGLREKEEQMQGAEVAWQVGKRITLEGLKDSQRISLGQRLVATEDREALCRLLAYPSIINLKAKTIIGQLAQKPKL